MDIKDRVLQAALERIGRRGRQAILAEFTKRREGMRNSQTPGHAFWYPELLRDEQDAAALLDLPAPIRDKNFQEK